MKLIQNIDWSRESWPYFFYRRVSDIYNTMEIRIQLDPGYHYLLQKINARWSSVNPNIPGAFANPPQIFIVKDAGRTTIQDTPFDFQLITSPAEGGMAEDIVNAARPFSARVLDRSAPIDLLYYYRDTIRISISNITTAAAVADLSLPAYIEFLIIGRYFPALNRKGW